MEREKTNQERKVEFSIRVPGELDKKIAEDAQKNNRSKSAQVNTVLEKHYSLKKEN